MKKVLILLAEGFEEIEALGTADILRRMGADVVLAGMENLAVAGSHNIKVEADMLFKDIDQAGFDAVVLPGGLPGSLNLYNDDRVIALLQKFAGENKITAAICAAPMVLDKAGLLGNRKFTMYPAEDLYKYLRDDKRPTDEMFVIDGKVVTGKGPGATAYFAGAVAEVLGIAPATVKNVLEGMFVK